MRLKFRQRKRVRKNIGVRVRVRMGVTTRMRARVRKGVRPKASKDDESEKIIERFSRGRDHVSPTLLVRVCAIN